MNGEDNLNFTEFDFDSITLDWDIPIDIATDATDLETKLPEFSIMNILPTIPETTETNISQPSSQR